jgi:formylglycine-generating enzyme required for sulfatase activity
MFGWTFFSKQNPVQTNPASFPPPTSISPKVMSTSFNPILQKTDSGPDYNQSYTTEAGITSLQTEITSSKTFGVGSTQFRKKDRMLMVYVPAGDFIMGSDIGEDDEKPEHTVSLPAFWIDQTEVTNGMFINCVNDKICQPPAKEFSNTRDNYYGNSAYDNFPVINVNWDQARIYCEWAGGKLPSEPEWEKAARGEDGRIFPWGNRDPEKNLANYLQSNISDTTEVGSFEVGESPYKIYDMAGNVWEWVADPYRPYPGLNSVTFKYDSKNYVIRGGSWNDYEQYIRTSNRKEKSPSDFGTNIGFRCVVPE